MFLMVLAGGLASAGWWIREAIIGMEAFRVTEVQVRGLRHVERQEVLDIMDLGSEASVWEPRDVWEARLVEHPLIRAVRSQRVLPGTLRVDVVERRPVALVPTPTLEPVDAEGVLLPIDPVAHRLDLPVLGGRTRVARGARIVPARLRRLAGEVSRLGEAEPTLMGMVSEVWWSDDNTLAARWSKPQVDLLLRPGTAPVRLREGLAVLAEALTRVPDRPPGTVDLRYADQVVVRAAAASEG